MRVEAGNSSVVRLASVLVLEALLRWADAEMNPGSMTVAHFCLMLRQHFLPWLLLVQPESQSMTLFKHFDSFNTTLKHLCSACLWRSHILVLDEYIVQIVPRDTRKPTYSNREGNARLCLFFLKHPVRVYSVQDAHVKTDREEAAIFADCHKLRLSVQALPGISESMTVGGKKK